MCFVDRNQIDRQAFDALQNPVGLQAFRGKVQEFVVSKLTADSSCDIKSMDIVPMYSRKMSLKYRGMVPFGRGPLKLPSHGHHGQGGYQQNGGEKCS